MQQPGFVAKLVDDETGVSPVIGVILMVAVTVIIAAVIGSSVLGLADSVEETPPQAQFEIETISQDAIRVDDDGQTMTFDPAVTISHTGGENIDTEKIKVQINGAPAYSLYNYPSLDDKSNYPLSFDYDEAQHADVMLPWQTAGSDAESVPSEISAGDSTTLLWYGSFVEDRGIVLDPITADGLGYATWSSDQTLHQRPGGATGGSSAAVWNYDDLTDSEYSEIESGDTVRVIWESGGQSQTLAEMEV